MTNDKPSVLARGFSVNDNKKRGGDQDVRTPKWLFKQLHEQFKFCLDPCDSVTHPGWLGVESYNLDRGEDGLRLPWLGSVFVNPPWNNIQEWFEKARCELSEGNCDFVVFLVPSRVETQWFHNFLESEFLMHHRFLKGRVQFAGRDNPYIIGISIFVLWRNLYE